MSMASALGQNDRSSDEAASALSGEATDVVGIPSAVEEPAFGIIRTASHSAWGARLRRWSALLFKFAAGQSAAQALNLLAGVALLRWLPVDGYAQYTLAFTFQSMVGMLCDIGFSASIVGLVGERGSDPAVVGRVIHTAQFYRDRCFLVLAVLAAVAFPLYAHHHGWGGWTTASLYLSLCGFVYAQRLGMYAAPLLIRQRLATYYVGGLFSSAGRLALIAGIWSTGWLSATAAAWIGAITVLAQGLYFRRASRPFVDESVPADPADHAAMRKYIGPLVPSMVFNAFQGQIAVLLIATFGGQKNIAEVAALGRLGQLFILLTTFNAVIIEPYFAKVAVSRLARRYGQILAIEVLIAALLTTFAFRWPEPLLWILGPHYAHLGGDVGWIVLTACIGFVNLGLFAMHSARRWIYYWSTVAYIVSLVMSQAIAAMMLDVSTTRGALQFGVVGAATVTGVHLATTVHSLLLPALRPNVAGPAEETVP